MKQMGGAPDNTKGLMDSRILIVDDDRDVLLAAEIVLKKHFGRILTATEPARLPELLASEPFDVLLLDMNFTAGKTSGREGMDWLAKSLELAPDTKVILMTAYGAVETAVAAIKHGAADFVVKPWDNERLVATVGACLRYSRAARTVTSLRSVQKVLDEDSGQSGREIVGSSKAMAKVMAQIGKVAATDAAVLITGENGTGKELVARAIHRASPRAGRAFVHVDLGAIAETLFESELFGHRKGAFTDAKEDRAGRFEVASGGTLFLDEIGNLSLKSQAKLLGVLQSQTVARLGSDRPIPVDARIVCATNLSAAELADPAQFRQDLLYRINTVTVDLPPLRQRPEDIAELVGYYLARFIRKYHKGPLALAPETLAALAAYPWPGNIRELVHAVERAVIMSEGGVLTAADLLPPTLAPALLSAGSPAAPATLAADELNLERLEARAIAQAIEKHGGNLSKAAQELGLGRTTLYRKMAKHGI